MINVFFMKNTAAVKAVEEDFAMFHGGPRRVLLLGY
jgi:hypothetical protein